MNVSQCSQCEAELAEDAKFCSQCGTSVASQSAMDVLRAAKNYACNAADDIVEGGTTLVTSDLGKKMAAGAVVGAVAVAPIPVVGWAAGATIGAGLVAFRQIAKKD